MEGLRSLTRPHIPQARTELGYINTLVEEL